MPMPVKSPLIHIASLIFDSPLAIIPEKLDTILRAIGPRLSLNRDTIDSLSLAGTRMSDEQFQQLLAYYDDDDEDSGTVADSPKKEKPYRLSDGGVAVIPIRGTLMKRGGWMSALSGCTSYESLRSAYDAAQSDDLVRGILFDVDSPGGTTHGCFELADYLRDCRGSKPTWSIANDCAASAAYALASSADRVFLTRTAGVGSIGVFALHCDQSQLDERMGTKYTYIHAGEKKVDGNPHEPLSRSARKDIQAEVDREYKMFIETVSRNRGVGSSDIRKTEAALFFAEDACPNLADEVSTYALTLEKLEKKVGRMRGSVPGKILGSVAAETELGNNVRQAATPKATPGEVEGDTNVAKIELDAKKTTAKKMKKSEADDMKKAGAKGKDCDAADPDEEDDEKKKREDDEDEDEDDEASSSSSPIAAESSDLDFDDEADLEAAVPVSPSVPARRRRASVTPIPTSVSADAQSTAAEIAELCEIAGMANLTGKYILAGYSVEKVRGFLRARRAKLSAEAGTVDSSLSPAAASPNGSSSVDRAIQQARANAAKSGGTVSASKALEQILLDNPGIYDEYDEERMRVSRQGTTRDMANYVSGTQKRYMRGLGLSSVVDAVPGR